MPLLDNDVDFTTEASLLAEKVRSNLHRLYGNCNRSALVLDNDISQIPRRRSGDVYTKILASHAAELIYPCPNGSLGSLIKYDADAKLLKKAAGSHNPPKEPKRRKWRSKIKKQGVWMPVDDPISSLGPLACPMPVLISSPESLEPFFLHLQIGGSDDIESTAIGKDLAYATTEPPYGTNMLEFEKGVLYADGRMDLCKKVLGPSNISELMKSLRTNDFVKHFLLGNNIIGPLGIREITRFLFEFPDRIRTWYLAGNCIDTINFRSLVDALVKSSSVNNIWLKRNPLLPDSAYDILRLISETKNLRTLDLEQTQVGDEGVVSIFGGLLRRESNSVLSLQNIYLNACGLGEKGVSTIGEYLASPKCSLKSLYLSKNPIGKSGLKALAYFLSKNRTIERLTLQSIGADDEGVIEICESLTGHTRLSMLDLGQSYANEDLGVRYNWLTDKSAFAIADLISYSSTLKYLNLGDCAMTCIGSTLISHAALKSPSLLFLSMKAFEWADVNTKEIRKQNELYKQLRLKVDQHLEKNVKNQYGNTMTYEKFLAGERRWLVSFKDDVRMIDSVYRNRDARLAMRGFAKLKKKWEENDTTLSHVMSS